MTNSEAHMNRVLITGVSTGIGHAAARELVAAGYHVLGSVRSAADAERLSAELGERFSVLQFDVTDFAAVDQAAQAVSAMLQGRNLRALVNNAGVSLPGPLLHMPPDTLRQSLEVNVMGLFYVSQRFAPLLGARHDAPRPRGRIVNISSVSGRVAYPFMGAYAASKHAVEALSDALRRELLLYDVDVVVIQPGTVRTPIVGKFAEHIASYRHTDYGPILEGVARQVARRQQTALPVASVTRAIRQAIESPSPKTRYAIPRKWLTGWILPRLLPDRWLDAFIARQLKP